MRLEIVTLLALFVPAIATAAPPPISDFTNFARYESLKISPNGSYLALTRRTEEFEALTVLHYPDLKVSMQTHFGSLTDVASFRWATDKRLLIEPARRFSGYISYKVPTGEIMGVSADGKGADMLFGYQAGAGKMQTGTRLEQRSSMDAAGEVIDRVPGKPSEVLMQTYGYGIEGDFNAVYRMDIYTGKLVRVIRSPLRNGTFVTDLERNVALVHGVDRVGDRQVFALSPKREWERLINADLTQGFIEPTGPSGKSGEFLVLDDRDAYTRGVSAWSPDTGATRLLYRNDEANLNLLGVDPANKPWGFSYTDHFPSYWYPDPSHPLAQVHRWLASGFKDHTITITSVTDDISLAVARVSAPRKPPRFFVVDVKNPKLLEELAAYPNLKSEHLANVDPIEFAARDGLKIRGYLTTPKGAQQKQLPMIVVVHGGPHGVYDTYDFDWEAQLFASRGYAVLQVNYRGSGGRGRKFAGAGFGRWGREMQDDITDGVKWAIGDGVADPQRICIYGASYGAYAALTGAFREPDMFRCAVGFAGIYDLPLMFEKGDIQTVDRGVNYLKAAVGTDPEELKRRSPVYNADKIHAAVMLLHGKVDARAPYEHAVRMRDALTKAGNPPEWFTEWGEGHGFFNEVNRVEAYSRILGFFDKHLKPPSTAVSNPLP